MFNLLHQICIYICSVYDWHYWINFLVPLLHNVLALCFIFIYNCYSIFEVFLTSGQGLQISLCRRFALSKFKKVASTFINEWFNAPPGEHAKLPISNTHKMLPVQMQKYWWWIIQLTYYWYIACELLPSVMCLRLFHCFRQFLSHLGL